jgi:phosphate transport system permease protein
MAHSPTQLPRHATGDIFQPSGKRGTRVTELIVKAFLYLCGLFTLVTTVGILLILVFEASQFFRHIPVTDFLFGTTWTPLFNEAQRSFGVLPEVRGTLVITAISACISLPLGLLCAIYLSEYASDRTRGVIKPALELLSGVPTIVYGYFALTFITPELLRPIFSGMDTLNALSAGIAVGIMTLPLVASLSEDAMRAVPRSMREAAYALGGTKLETATRVILPAAMSGILASFILALSRAIGETMIVALAAGSRPSRSWNPTEGMQTMTGYIAQVFDGDVVNGTVQFQSLFAVGLLLFLITLLMNIVSHWISDRFREEYQ